MRDFRDSKVMARTLRAVLAANGLKITISQSLELIAKAFGVADWNTLAAAIRRGAPAPRNDASPPPSPTGASTARFSGELESTLHRALAEANYRGHEYATLEHLLRALIDDRDASAVMKASNVDLGALKKKVVNYIDNELAELARPDGGDPRPTAAFQRVIERAVIRIQSSGREEVTGANVLQAMFAETESPAVWLLGEQNMTSIYGIVKRSRNAARRPQKTGKSANTSPSSRSR